MIRSSVRLVWVLAMALLTLAAAACSDSNTPSKAQDDFLTGMIPHHESAVEMADIALQRSQRPEIRQLAQNIKQDQNREIEQMKRILGDKASAAASGGHGGHGGANQSDDLATEVERLRSAEPFDQAFIDAMIPHHESAITSAKAVRGKAKDKEVNDLAAAIISAQEREIAQMKEWRRQWYGS